jgi:hypothetical protein
MCSAAALQIFYPPLLLFSRLLLKVTTIAQILFSIAATTMCAYIKVSNEQFCHSEALFQSKNHKLYTQILLSYFQQENFVNLKATICALAKNRMI